jgi:hypothetical protein
MTIHRDIFDPHDNLFLLIDFYIFFSILKPFDSTTIHFIFVHLGSHRSDLIFLQLIITRLVANYINHHHISVTCYHFVYLNLHNELIPSNLSYS